VNSSAHLEVGDSKGGYRVESDGASNVRVVAWGFWDVQVAARFGGDVRAACRRNVRTSDLVFDMGDLKPMRDEGQQCFAEIVASLSAMSVENATVLTASQLTKLQLLRIVKANDRTGRVRFAEALAGSGWAR
jgi:GAF domain-containing protein